MQEEVLIMHLNKLIDCSLLLTLYLLKSITKEITQTKLRKN